MQSLKQFSIFLDPYYWRTAVLIARSHLFKQYRNSYLGILWTLIQPLSMVCVYAIIMPMIIRMQVKDYLLYIISTLPLWGLIYAVFTHASSSLLAQAETLKRCMISSTIFPVADVLRHTYTYLVSFSVMFLVAMLFGYEVTWHALLLPVFFLPVMLIVMAVAVGIAFVAPYMRDVGELVMLGMNFMMWFAAVPFPISVVPEQYRVFFEWNPFYVLLEPTIMLVYQHTLPGPVVLMKLALLMGISVTFGYTLYRLCRRNFVYYL